MRIITISWDDGNILDIEIMKMLKNCHLKGISIFHHCQRKRYEKCV